MDVFLLTHLRVIRYDTVLSLHGGGRAEDVFCPPLSHCCVSVSS